MNLGIKVVVKYIETGSRPTCNVRYLHVVTMNKYLLQNCALRVSKTEDEINQSINQSELFKVA